MSIKTITEKLQKLETSIETMQQYVKRTSEKASKNTIDHEFYCYFNYSTIIHEDADDTHLIIGSFHVKSISPEVINDPVILLKVSADSPCDFSGKFKTENQTDQPYTFLWERVIMDEVDPQTHFCFKPTQNNTLQPNEQLSFQNFQVKVPTYESITIEGFTYFNQENDGVPALNSIQLD